MTPDQNSDTPRFHQDQPTVQKIVERIPKRVQVSLVLIIVGVLGRSISRGSPSFRFLFGLTYNIGILLLVAWLAKLFVLPLVRKQQVVEQWSLLIENGQERGSELLEHSRKLILDTRAPNITMEDKDMAPGLTAESTYVPGKGFMYTYQGMMKGTIPGSEFMKMYYRTNVGENAQERVRKGLMGL